MRWRSAGGIVALLVAACSSGGSHAPVVEAAESTTTTTSTTASASTAPAAVGQPVTIVFAGDINFYGETATRLAQDPQTAIGPFTDILSAADLAVGNFESALGTRGTPENKQFTYQAPPSAIDALRAGGFDVISMANNHGRDYGEDGLEESLAIKDAQPDHFLIGIGHNDTDAYAPFTATINGQQIAVIGATQVIDGDLVDDWTATATHPGLASAKRADALVAAVQQARATAGIVVVYLHWGVELEGCPTETQQVLAQQLADAGADIVIGGHAHRLLGAGMLGTTFVGYGLGNFDFGAHSPVTQATGVVRVTMTGRHLDKYEFIPGFIQGGIARPLNGDAVQPAIDDWNALRSCTGLST